MQGGKECATGSFARKLERMAGNARFFYPARPYFIRHGYRWTWRAKPLPCYDLWVATEGQAFLCVDGEEYAIRPGTAFILPPGYRPLGRFDAGHCFANFYCRFQVLDKSGQIISASDLRWPTGPFHLHDLSQVHELARTLERGVCYNTSLSLRQADLALWCLLLECALSSQIEQESAVRDQRIEAVRKAVTKAPEQAWTVQQMARLACLSHNQFTRLFLSQVGCTPKRYALRQRIERACFLLKETDAPLSVVAENLGYKNEYYFNRQFRQHVGQSPGAYRRKAEMALPG